MNAIEIHILATKILTASIKLARFLVFVPKASAGTEAFAHLTRRTMANKTIQLATTTGPSIADL